MNVRTLSIIVGILLLLAVLNGWPYGYFVILRWIVSGASAYLAFHFYQSKLNAWVFIFLGIVFLFNPLLPVYMSKSSWIPIDFITSVLFFLAAYSKKIHV